MRDSRKFLIDNSRRALCKAKQNYLRTGDMEYGLQIEIFSDEVCNAYDTTATNFRPKREHTNKYSRG